MSVPRVLSIAGTDPTGGAGMQADLKAIAAHDGYGMGVVTALVAQNTHGVRSVHLPDVGFLREQLDAVSDDVVVDAVKIGMLGTADVVRVVTDWLREHQPPVVVVDPVMVATSGDRLLDEDAASAMGALFALADLVTPNRAEPRGAGGASPARVRLVPVRRRRLRRRRLRRWMPRVPWRRGGTSWCWRRAATTKGRPPMTCSWHRTEPCGCSPVPASRRRTRTAPGARCPVRSRRSPRGTATGNSRSGWRRSG